MVETYEKINRLVTFANPKLYEYIRAISKTYSTKKLINEELVIPSPSLPISQRPEENQAQPSKVLKAIKKSCQAENSLVINTRIENTPKIEMWKEDKSKVDSIPALPAKRMRQIDPGDIPLFERRKCPLCEWIFPSDFTEPEMNKHVNLCVEGHGIDDIKAYHESMRAIRKMNKNKEVKEDHKSELVVETLALKIAEREHKKPIIASNSAFKYSSDCSEDEEEERVIICPHCKLSIGKRSDDFIERHIRECGEERYALYGESEKFYQEIGNIPKLPKIETQSLRMFKKKIKRQI